MTSVSFSQRCRRLFLLIFQALEYHSETCKYIEQVRTADLLRGSHFQLLGRPASTFPPSGPYHHPHRLPALSQEARRRAYP